MLLLLWLLMWLLILLLETLATGWIKGKLERDNGVGYIPSNYVRKVISKPQSEYAIAKLDYVASGLEMSNGEADISISKGEAMHVLDTCANGWTRIELISNGTVGLVPESYIRRVGTSSDPPTKSTVSVHLRVSGMRTLHFWH